MTDTPERDPLEELLAPPRPADTEALRRATLAVTTRRLRRRRWARRASLAAALAACYVAGLVTVRLLAPAPPAAVVAVTPPREPKPEAPVASTHPVELEQRADGAADRERVAQLRQAGDRYLDQDNDPAAALRCYREALKAGSAEDAKFSPDDNWLLMAIKNAREKEARHADNDG